MSEFISILNEMPPSIITGEIEPLEFNGRLMNGKEFIDKVDKFFEYLVNCGYKKISTLKARGRYKYRSREFFAIHSSIARG